jgi:copper homeostasis protein
MSLTPLKGTIKFAIKEKSQIQPVISMQNILYAGNQTRINPSMKYCLEICCFNIQSAINAQQAGASRIELCADPSDGGTTPSLGTIKTARENLHINLYPIIRPRGGDFLYSREEFEIMMNDVVLCKQIGCEGVVTGMLTADGKVDKKRTAKLVELAYPAGVTFHRAFDWSVNPQEALEDIISIGCERLLTSGQLPTALEGVSLIHDLVEQADNRIIIMPGSGIRGSNILQIAEQTKTEEFHTSARIPQESKMKYKGPHMTDNISTVIADQTEIELIIHLLTHHEKSS